MKFNDVVVVAGATVYMGLGAFIGLLFYSKIVEAATGKPIVVTSK